MMIIKIFESIFLCKYFFDSTYTIQPFANGKTRSQSRYLKKTFLSSLPCFRIKQHAWYSNSLYLQKDWNIEVWCHDGVLVHLFFCILLVWHSQSDCWPTIVSLNIVSKHSIHFWKKWCTWILGNNSGDNRLHHTVASYLTGVNVVQLKLT